MVKKAQLSTAAPAMIDIACLIHGQVYSWDYVDRLRNMLTRHLTIPFRMHVYTEHFRPVTEPYIKHTLIDWSLPPNKKAWWYKMQLFNSDQHRGNLLYFDLDTVITGNIDWIWQQSTRYFWAVRDFKYLWKPNYYQINSSVMWWDTTKYDHVWRDFQSRDILDIVRKYHGDQDFINVSIPQNERRCFDNDAIKSWRWQCFDGGYDFRRRIYHTPGAGTQFGPETSVLVFHGNPKPGDTRDPVIEQHWR